MPSLGKTLRTWAEAHGHRQTLDMFVDGLRSRRINPNEVSIRELAESYMGPDWQGQLRLLGRNPSALRSMGDDVAFAESGDAVDSSAFANITGQLLVNEVKAQYEPGDMIGDMVCSTVPVTNGNLGTQKVPYLSPAVDPLTGQLRTVQQGMEYPRTEFQEQYITYPAIRKFGEICAVTMEAIYSDLTQQIRESAGSVGLRIRQEKEEVILRTVLGIDNSFSWNGTSYNTYQASTPWINTVGSTPFLDWSSLNSAEQLLVQMTDPVTGKPIKVQPNALLVMPAKYYTFMRTMNAIEVRTGDGASNTQATYAASPLATNYPVLKSQYARQLLITSAANLGAGLTATQADEYWYLGDFKRAFVWRQYLPFETFVAPPGTPDEFQRDVVLQVKAREAGVAGVRDPRFVVKMYST